MLLTVMALLYLRLCYIKILSDFHSECCIFKKIRTIILMIELERELFYCMVKGH
jgi:hypothetical protein